MTFEEELAKANDYVADIGNYLLERAQTDTTIAKNLEKENKSLEKCFQFIIDKAKKMSKGNCAKVKDEVVYGWAVHYYDEENLSIDKEINHSASDEKQNNISKDKTASVLKKKKDVIDTDEQLSLF